MKYKYDRDLIIKLSDGRHASDIAKIVGCGRGYVQKLWNKNPHLPRPKACAPRGEHNPAWKGGRTIQRCGRVLAPAPEGHPFARVYSNKKIGRVLEHRLVMEQVLGRYLTEREVVDHIDGCVLNNAPSNLRVFQSNAEHLRATISDRPKDLSFAGRVRVRATHAQREVTKSVSNHKQMWRCGDERLLQILHAHLLLDKASPYLSGTQRYLADRQIDWSVRQNLIDSVVMLCHKWELPHRLSRLENLF